MRRWQILRNVILPQAFKKMIPPLTGQIISTIKDSAIVSIISIQELTFQGMELMAATYLTFEVWITITVLYFILTYSCSRAASFIEERMQQA
jgi:polar amino acid transport system permease protein